MAAPVSELDDQAPDQTAAGTPILIPPIKDVVHGIGEKLRESIDRLRDVYARRRRARMITLGLFLVGAYVLFTSDDES
jgi:hypothetical protein